MALAILELIAWEAGKARFRMDTGTNAYYQVKIGRSVRDNQGIDWVDDIFFSTPIARNKAGGNLLDSSQEIVVPVPRFDEGKASVQLFSYKTPQGKSPAFSRIVTMQKGLDVLPPADFALPFSIGAAMNMTPSFQSPRRVPCRTHREVYAHQASLDDLLGGIVKLAAPVVLDLIKGTLSGKAGQTAPSGTTGTANTTGTPDQANLITQLLTAILGSIPGEAGKALSGAKSLGSSSVHGNRFAAPQSSLYSHPFIFGIDDALLGTIIGPMIGPIVQLLPQLMNATNQQRLQMKQTDNKLVTDILSDINRRRIMEQLLQAKSQSPVPAFGSQEGDAAAQAQLLQMIQQMLATQPPASPAPTPTPTPPPAPALTKSLSEGVLSSPSILSSKAVVSFVTADPVLWNGTPKVLFTLEQDVQLKIRLDVADPVPKMPLPKAILKIVFKSGSDASVLFEKTFKQKNVLPNTEMAFRFASAELARLPLDTPLSVLAELRWLTPKSGKEYKALGSTEIILVGKYFLKAQGLRAAPERELTDMKRFRPFWNKVWEAPVLDAANRDEDRKTRWDLDVNMKYSVLLSATHESNGLMETKLLGGTGDSGSISARTEGRMKSGIELSPAELNKLLPLWNGEQALDADKLQAFRTEAFAKDNAGEFIFNLKLKGRAGERGMVWVVPIFALFDFPLNTVSTTDDAGQVTAVGEERVRFPLPVSARVLGLKSE